MPKTVGTVERKRACFKEISSVCCTQNLVVAGIEIVEKYILIKKNRIDYVTT